MAQNSYTNADLPRFERKKFSIKTERPAIPQSPVPGLEDGESIDQRLADAKGTLANADNLQREIASTPDYSREKAIADRENADIPSVMDSPVDKLWKLTKHYVATRPEAAEKGALAGIFSDPMIAGPSAAVLGLRSAANLVQGGKERVTEHPFQTAMDVAGLGLGGQAVKGGINLLKPAAAVEDSASVATAMKALKDLVGRKGAPGAVTQPQLNEMPLYAQMEHLPTRGSGTPAAGREAYPSVNSRFPYAGPSLPEKPMSTFERMSANGDFAGDRATGHFDPSNLATGREEGLGAVPRYEAEQQQAASLRGLKTVTDPRITGLPPEVTENGRNPEFDALVTKYLTQGGAPQTNAALNGLRESGSVRPLADLAAMPKLAPRGAKAQNPIATARQLMTVSPKDAEVRDLLEQIPSFKALMFNWGK